MPPPMTGGGSGGGGSLQSFSCVCRMSLDVESEVDEPPGELPHYDPEGPHSSDLEDPSPELEGSLLHEHECQRTLAV